MQPMPVQPVRVLIVDDDPQLLMRYVEYLPVLSNGMVAVRTSQDGISGLQDVLTYQPEVVIIDIQMPGINGHQLARLLSGDPDTAGIFLIILSGMKGSETQRVGDISLDTGADIYLMKPVDPHDLITHILSVRLLTPSQRLLRIQQRAQAFTELGS